MQLAGSLMVLSGRLDITNNDLIGTDGGALQFVSFSQLKILKGSEIHFENNTGTYVSTTHYYRIDPAMSCKSAQHLYKWSKLQH